MMKTINLVKRISLLHFITSFFIIVSVLTVNIIMVRAVDDFVSQIDEIIDERLRNVTSLNNLTRCSSTELTLSKESLLYTWEMKGLLGYYSFMKKFALMFELKTQEISFKSDLVDGKWYFKLSKIVSSPGTEELVLTSTYSYEAKQAKKLNFHIHLSIVHEEKEIVLPVQKSTTPVVMQQRLYNRRGYSSYLEYVHTFTWSNVDLAIENIIKQHSPTSSPGETIEELERSSESETNNNADEPSFGKNENILLRYAINSFFPSDPVYLSSENCQSTQSGTLHGLIRDGDSRYSTKRYLNPPYVKHSNSMLHDERFADVLIKAAGDQEFHAHRIILATSSPVFSALLHNETNETEHLLEMNDANNVTSTSETIEPLTIHIDRELSGEVIMEMLRYIYTGKANSMDKHANKMIIAAEKYELPELKMMCEKILFSQIRPSNAIEMYNLGYQVSSSFLIRKAFAVMKVNKSKIVSQSEEFKRLTSKHPNLMFELFLS